MAMLPSGENTEKGLGKNYRETEEEEAMTSKAGGKGRAHRLWETGRSRRIGQLNEMQTRAEPKSKPSASGTREVGKEAFLAWKGY